MRASRLESISLLNFSQKKEIFIEDKENQSCKIIDGHHIDAIEAKEPNDEIRLMTSSVVDADVVAEAFNQITREFFSGCGECVGRKLRVGEDG